MTRTAHVLYKTSSGGTVKKKKLNLPRVPLPRQTGGYHRPGKGRGSYKRQSEKLALKKERE